jgi:hypothetical protein
MSAKIPNSLIPMLCCFNQDIIKQKIDLLRLLVDKYGKESTFTIYQRRCPVVYASIGQHFRHSLDHIERASDAAAESINTSTSRAIIEYDVRDRGCLDETDWNIALDRMQHVTNILEAIKQKHTPTLMDKAVCTRFMLSGNTTDQYPLSSTVGRELGFAGHHAIHHMAMVRIIVSNEHSKSQLLSKHELPEDFGKAPSTSNFESDDKVH